MEDHDLRVSWSEQEGFVVEDRAGRKILPHPIRPRVLDAFELACDLQVYAVYRSVRSIANHDGVLHDAVKVTIRRGWLEDAGEPDSFHEDPSIWDDGVRMMEDKPNPGK